ncbi:SusC/RagA family TonB-linked outer membrane protein [Parasediminibacterium sp. JCM 36343]|uniref:SusC/RagA family TonB-linked outer membrane protein n=1 Tax=Parasediminibacterium sp. JCM 36343 TaxID=3374279 RepID=UPI00397A654A
MIGFVCQSIAQEPRKTQKITGTVTNSDKSPLVGAGIKIKNRTIGTTTDENGKFSINAALTDTLIVTYVNYINQSIRINNRTNVDIVMMDAANSMNEVIVIGYGSLKRKELTGVVGKVNMDDVRKAPVTSFDQALAGRIAGVTVSTNDGQPGAGSQISIRGTSAGQDVSPLYVVDGFPIENMDINSINTNDIESIDILKDASSIAIYGSRGANGVIIITTKKGKAQPTRISYNVFDGIQTQTKHIKLLSPYEFVKLQLDIDSAYGNTSPIGYRRYIDTANGIDLNYYKSVNGYDWQKMLLQTGLLQTHNLSIIGGNTDLKYAINGSYTNQKGIIINTGLKKYDGKFSIDNKFSDNIKYGFSLNYSNTTSFGTIPTSGATGGVVSNMWAFRPVDIIGGTLLDAQLIDSSQINGSSFTPDNLVNPFQQATNEYRKNITKTTTFNSYLEYKINQDLQLRVTAGTSNTALIAETFYNTKTKEGLLIKNTNGTLYNINGINGSVNNVNNNTYLLNALMSYRNVRDRGHILDAVMGVDYSYGKATANGYTSILIPQGLEGLGINSLGGGTVSKFGYSPSQNQLYSVLGRINYSLLERYIFTVTGREDGSSKFAPGKQWGFFPSGAFAWHFTNESFMRRGGMSKIATLTRLYDGKLRVSYGFVGNNRVGDYSYLYQNATGTGSGYPVNNVNTSGTIPYFIGNPTLTWETTGQLDIGTTLSFLGDKILIDMDYYDKRTTNSLLAVPLSSISGYNVGNVLQYQNAGIIRNRGFEFTMTTTNIQKKKFTWITSFNIAFNRNKIISFYNGVDTKLTPSAWVAKVGYPISQFFGYKWAGVYQYTDFNKLANGNYVLKNGIPTYGNNAVVQPGDPKYADLNGDGVVTEGDRTIIGSPLPIHTGGLSNNFKYGNFDLGIFFQWSYGNQVLNQNKMVFDYSGNFYTNSNQFADYVNRWSPTNPTNDIPRATNKIGGQDPDGITRESSRLIEDASYLRFKTISLKYSVPFKTINKYKLSSLAFYISAQNIFTITKYSGQDPEVSTYRAANPSNVPSGITGGNATGGAGYSYVQPSSGTPALAQGYDLTAYPRGRTYVIGALISF